MKIELWHTFVLSFHGDLGWTAEEYVDDLRENYNVDVVFHDSRWVQIIGSYDNVKRFIQEDCCDEITLGVDSIMRHW